MAPDRPLFRPRHNYTISDADRAYIYKRDGHQCLKCGSDSDLTIDHITPRAYGGLDVRGNYQTLCFSCNSSKGASFADYRPGADGQLWLPLIPEKPTLRERFMAKVEKRPDGCWEWAGAKLSTGTGAMNVEGRLETAPRVSYGLFVGDIPEGEWVYRSCENRECVAPSHLYTDEPGRSYGDAHEPRDACAKGHRYTPDNVKYESGRRRCRTCRNAAGRRYARRKKSTSTG